MRLNRYLAAAGFGSRRSCEDLIRGGHVMINGHGITDLATQVETNDDVRVNGQRAKVALPVYILLNKPKGYLSTSEDELGRQTVFDLIPGHFGRLFHVGRLDKDSEGLILLTNDGAIAQKLTHPGHEVEKEYEVLIDKPFDAANVPKMIRGFSIEGGRARAESVRIIAPNKLKIILRQGIKRQIRLMLYTLGYEVKRLTRTRIGGLRAPEIRPGMWKQLTKNEIGQILPGQAKAKANANAKTKPAKK